jgi:Mn-dependent DtxR family transcriptional regulator
MCDKVSKAFNFDVMGITEKDQDVYAWLIERHASGQTIEAFAEWARVKERAQYIRKYRNDTGNIRNDWNLAFTTSRSSADEILI